MNETTNVNFETYLLHSTKTYLCLFLPFVLKNLLEIHYFVNN